jgi:hypothetical protein
MRTGAAFVHPVMVTADASVGGRRCEPTRCAPPRCRSRGAEADPPCRGSHPFRQPRRSRICFSPNVFRRTDRRLTAGSREVGRSRLPPWAYESRYAAKGLAQRVRSGHFSVATFSARPVNEITREQIANWVGKLSAPVKPRPRFAVGRHRAICAGKAGFTYPPARASSSRSHKAGCTGFSGTFVHGPRSQLSVRGRSPRMQGRIRS